MGTTRDGTALVVPITLFLALDAGMKPAGAEQCSEAAHPVSAADGSRSGKRSSVDRPNSFAGASKSGLFGATHAFFCSAVELELLRSCLGLLGPNELLLAAGKQMPRAGVQDANGVVERGALALSIQCRRGL